MNDDNLGPEAALFRERGVYLDRESERDEQMRRQGLAAADVYFLSEGRTNLSDIAERLSAEAGPGMKEISRTAVTNWVQRYGPRQYVGVRRRDDKYEVATFPLATDASARPQLIFEKINRQIARLRREGWLIVPALWEVVATEVVDPKELWERVSQLPSPP